MFSFFHKTAGPKITDLVFAKQAAKWNGLLAAAKRNPETIFVAWFDDSLEKLQLFFESHQATPQLITARQVHSGIVAGKPVIFIEHYPLKEKELLVYSSLIGQRLTVYSSLDEALFRVFGGDRISSLLEKMGMEENEAINHSMVTKAIANAQEKLAQKVSVDQSARSMDEWLQKNVGSLIP
jgi:hypothetical protein